MDVAKKFASESPAASASANSWCDVHPRWRKTATQSVKFVLRLVLSCLLIIGFDRCVTSGRPRLRLLAFTLEISDEVVEMVVVGNNAVRDVAATRGADTRAFKFAGEAPQVASSVAKISLH